MIKETFRQTNRYLTFNITRQCVQPRERIRSLVWIGKETFSMRSQLCYARKNNVFSALVLNQSKKEGSECSKLRQVYFYCSIGTR